MISVAQRFEDVGGRPSGFDYLRLVLASLVIVWHSFSVTGVGYAAVFSYLGVFGEFAFPMILAMFFALSGYLVSGSLDRCKTLVSFMGLRAIRIYPALAVEVMLSAFIIGPWLTVVPLHDYFTSPVFFTYLLNALGDIHYQLPGLFLDNPRSNIVNSQLWTVPWELACYVVLAGLVLVGARKWPLIFPLAMIAGVIYITVFPHVPRGTRLVIAFLGGISIHCYRNRIPWNLGVFLAVLATAAAAAFLRQNGLLVACAAYLTVYIGLCNPRRNVVIRGADFSYGIYLYGYVIQQALYQLLPAARHWYGNAILSLMVAACFAAFSWYCVEKPALGLRARVKQLEDAYLRRTRRRTLDEATVQP